MTRSATAAVALVSLALAACGSSSTTDPAAQPATATPAESPAAAEPAPEEEPAEEVAAEPALAPETTMQPAPTVLEEVPVETDAPAPAEGSELEEPAPEPVEEPAPEPVYIWPDDGCSADNSPTPAAAADGPAPVVEIRPDAANSPLPDLAVRRINCKGGWENLRNELPSDRALLVWFWAPH